MRTWRFLAALIAALISIAIASPTSAQVVTINGFGVATGTETFFYCLGSGPPSSATCGSETKPWADQIDFNMMVDVSGTNVSSGACRGVSPGYFPGVCNVAIGVPQQVWFVDPFLIPFQLQGQGFTLTYLGQDQSGSYLFEGASYTDFLHHYCGPYSACPGHTYSAQAERFTISVVPELRSWAMMLLGFFGIGAATRRRRTTAMLCGLGSRSVPRTAN